MAAIRHDKKIRGGARRTGGSATPTGCRTSGTHCFVLLEEIGRPTIRDDVSEQRVREAYESLLP